MVALFKDRSPAAIIWLFILSIIVHSYFFIDFTGVYAPKNNGLFALFLNRYWAGISPAILIFLYHIIVFLQALQLNNLFTRQKMFGKANYLPAMSYILLTGLFKEWSYLSPALLDNFIVIWLYAKCLGFYNTPDPKILLFNTGLLIGSSVLLYHPSAALLVVALFALVSLRAFAVTEWFVLLMGAICPYYFLMAYLYLTDAFAFAMSYVPAYYLHLPAAKPTVLFYVTVGVVLLILIIGLVNWQRENSRLIIQIRKNWTIMLVMLVALFSIPFINNLSGVESFVLWLVPASSFIAKGFFVPKNKLVPVLMFWGLLALAYINSWST